MGNKQKSIHPFPLFVLLPVVRAAHSNFSPKPISYRKFLITKRLEIVSKKYRCFYKHQNNPHQATCSARLRIPLNQGSHCRNRARLILSLTLRVNRFPAITRSPLPNQCKRIEIYQLTSVRVDFDPSEPLFVVISPPSSYLYTSLFTPR